MLIDTSGLPRGAPAVASSASSARAEVGASDEPGLDAAIAPLERGGLPGRAAPQELPAEWFREHVNTLWRLVGRLGVPAGHVEDVVQEVFIIACRRRADIEDDRVRSFLFGTAIRLCKNYKRRASTRLEVSRDEALDPLASRDPDAEQLLITKRWRELLDVALARLSDAHRTVFVLFELEGMSSPEIAELLALPLGTVASRLQRARVRFLEVAAELHAAATESP